MSLPPSPTSSRRRQISAQPLDLKSWRGACDCGWESPELSTTEGAAWALAWHHRDVVHDHPEAYRDPEAPAPPPREPRAPRDQRYERPVLHCKPGQPHVWLDGCCLRCLKTIEEVEG